jgi:hypothetical protein
LLQRTADVADGSLVDIRAATSDVRFTPESGHLQCTRRCLLWAKSGHRAGIIYPRQTLCLIENEGRQ